MGEPSFLGMLTSDVIATFDQQLDTLKIAQIGDRINFFGMIRSVDMDAVMLDHCVRGQS